MPKRYIFIALALLVTALLLWSFAPPLASATPDERQLLKLVTAFERSDGNCLPLLTDRYVFGGTYGFPLKEEHWLDPIYERTKPRDVSLIAGSGDGVTFTGIFLNGRDAICTQHVKIQTPAIRGDIAFVNFRRDSLQSYGRYQPPSFNGSYAFQRSGLGWRMVAGKEKDDLPVR